MTAGAPVAAVETSVWMVGKEITGIVRVRVVITDVVVAGMVEDMIGRSKGVWSGDFTAASFDSQRVPAASNFSGIGSFFINIDSLNFLLFHLSSYARMEDFV